MCVFLWSVVSLSWLMLLQEAEVWQQFRGKAKVQVGGLSAELFFFSLFWVFVSVGEGVDEAGEGFSFRHFQLDKQQKAEVGKVI